MALATYGLVIVGSALMVNIGLGTMSVLQWVLYVGVAVLVNVLFYSAFRLNLNLKLRDPSLTREQIVASALWGAIPLWALPDARPIILMLYLPPFSFGMLRFTRRQYLATVPILMGIYAAVLAAERATGRPGFRVDRELFLFVVYGLLLTWFAFFGGFVSALRRELGDKKRATEKAHVELQGEMVERIRTQAENEKLIGELEASLADVKRLSGLLPICAGCKKIRDDKGYWNQIESYISMHSEVDFSHGICPDCAERLYPGMTDLEPVPGPSKPR
jgi:hypothetical protein